MILPTPPGKGDSVLQWARNMTAYLRSLRPSSGPGIRIQHTPAGMAISTDPARPTPTEPPLLLPWQAYNPPYEGEGKAPDDWWRKFRIHPGAINNALPDNFLEVFTATSSPQSYNLELTFGRENTPNGSILSITEAKLTIEPVLFNFLMIFNRDGEGVPIGAKILLGTVITNENAHKIINNRYRPNSFSVHLIQTMSSCTEVQYSALLSQV